MTQHSHREYIEGCFRCELSRDEIWFEEGDRVVVREDAPGRFAKYAGKTATVMGVSINSGVLELDLGQLRDWLAPRHVDLKDQR